MWRVTVPGEVLASPAVGGRTVIVKTIDGKVIALDSETGKQLWLYHHGSPSLVLRGGSTPVIKNNKVVVGFSDGKLALFDLKKGRFDMGGYSSNP